MLGCSALHVVAECVTASDIARLRRACSQLYRQLRFEYLKRQVFPYDIALVHSDREKIRVIEGAQCWNVEDNTRFPNIQSLCVTEVKDYAIPTTLTALTHGNKINKLPSALTTLHCQCNEWLMTDADVIYDLPPSLTSLRLGTMSTWKDNLPPSLLHLSLGILSPALRALPTALLSLDIGPTYNQPLEIGLLPKTLTFLQCGSYFNQPFDIGVLPDGLLTLECSCNYSQAFNLKVLPDTLTSLCHGTARIHLEALPRGLTHLQSSRGKDVPNLNHHFDQLVTLDLHDALGCLSISHFSWFQTLPTSLTVLRLPVNCTFELTIESLPPKLRILTCGDVCDRAARPCVLPTTLCELHLHSAWHNDIVFNPNLCRLKFGQRETGALPTFPFFLKTLLLSEKYSGPFFCEVLPSITTLVFKSEFMGNIPRGILPDSLTVLVFSSARWTCGGLDIGVLPSSLRYLMLPNYDLRLRPGVLPVGLTHLIACDYPYVFPTGVLPMSLAYLQRDNGYSFGRDVIPKGCIASNDIKVTWVQFLKRRFATGSFEYDD